MKHSTYVAGKALVIDGRAIKAGDPVDAETIGADRLANGLASDAIVESDVLEAPRREPGREQ